MRFLIVILGLSLVLGFARLAGACAQDINGAGKADKFVVNAELKETSPFVPVGAYMADRGQAGLARDVMIASALAQQTWGLGLTEFGSLRILVIRQRDRDEIRPEEHDALPFRLTTAYIRYQGEPVLTILLPEVPTPEDVPLLRNSIHYGMGLAAFAAFSRRVGLTELSAETVARARSGVAADVEELVVRLREAREREVRIATVGPIHDVARVIAHAFAAESARRAGLEQQPFLNLLAVSSLERSAGMLRHALEETAAEDRVAMLTGWSHRVVEHCQDFRDGNPGYVQQAIPEVDAETVALIRRSGLPGVDEQVVIGAKAAWRRYRRLVDVTGLRARRKSLEALDRAIANPTPLN